MITRNTKLRKVQIDKNEVVYRTLNVNEINFINNIKNEAHQYETACKLGIYQCDIELTFSQKFSLGKDILYYSQNIAFDKELMAETKAKFKKNISNDYVLQLMIQIVEKFKNISMLDLFQLTYDDVIELGILCGVMDNESKTNNDPNTPEGYERIDGKLYFKDDGKSLEDKIKENSKFYG